MPTSQNFLKLFGLLAMALVFIPCLQKGMFLDGVNYANVANNLANGKGSIWSLTYSDTFLKQYTHQLPFMIWCQGLFFYLFGDSILIERIFCLVLLVLNAYAIIRLWKLSFPSCGSYFGFPLVLWIITPIVFWGFSNNVQEIMMSFCAVMSISYIFQYFETKANVNLIIGGLYCFLCFFCKGVQGLFPLVAIPAYYILVDRKVKWSLIKEEILFILPSLVCLTMVVAYTPSRKMMEANFNDRLKSTFVTTVQNTTDNRLDLIGTLAMELLAPISLSIILLLICRFSKTVLKINWQRKSLFFIFIGLTASLPLIVTLEQRRFYLITSIPFFIIGLAGLIAPLLPILKKDDKFQNVFGRIITFVTIAAFLFGIINYDAYKRDERLLNDVHKIGSIVPNKTISADPKIMYEYSFIAYIARHYNISLDFDQNNAHDYHVSIKKEENKDSGKISKSFLLEKIER